MATGSFLFWFSAALGRASQRVKPTKAPRSEWQVLTHATGSRGKWATRHGRDFRSSVDFLVVLPSLPGEAKWRPCLTREKVPRRMRKPEGLCWFICVCVEDP
eukprot:symbB.v1.2.002522.t1/scaffold134.1/size305535/6